MRDENVTPFQDSESLLQILTFDAQSATPPRLCGSQAGGAVSGMSKDAGDRDKDGSAEVLVAIRGNNPGPPITLC